jgi:hypothetical protein
LGSSRFQLRKKLYKYLLSPYMFTSPLSLCLSDAMNTVPIILFGRKISKTLNP